MAPSCLSRWGRSTTTRSDRPERASHGQPRPRMWGGLQTSRSPWPHAAPMPETSYHGSVVSSPYFQTAPMFGTKSWAQRQSRAGWLLPASLEVADLATAPRRRSAPKYTRRPTAPHGRPPGGDSCCQMRNAHNGRDGSESLEGGQGGTVDREDIQHPTSHIQCQRTGQPLDVGGSRLDVGCSLIRLACPSRSNNP
jgi:hypothetical protein